MSQTPLSGRTASKLQLLSSPPLAPIVKRARHARAFFFGKVLAVWYKIGSIGMS